MYFRPDGNMHKSTQSIFPDGSDKFFTIDESYCPTMQNHPLIFDEVIQKTIWHYVENVRIYKNQNRYLIQYIYLQNELQVAVHLLLALYPKLGENKVLELFNAAHFEWIGMYIGKNIYIS